MDVQDVAGFFRQECNSPEGQELRALIEHHSDAMVAKSKQGRPALEAVLPHLPLRLAEALKKRDSLMQAFGHMAKLEMRDRGLNEKSTIKDYKWPEIRGESALTTFHEAPTASGQSSSM